MTNKQKKRIIWLSIAIGVCILVLASAIYLSIYYKADTDIAEKFPCSELITVEETDSYTAFIPNDKATAGFIFYPGGKVDDKAYHPLLQTLAEYGIFTAVAKMPFRLAVFGVNTADKIREDYPEIEEWYIGGHSLGGSMAASHLAKHESDYRGIVLLGSYSTKDISGTDISALSIYGSNDEVLNEKKYEKNRKNLPTDLSELVIDGGNHAYFGAYGEQKGDGEATVTNAEQIYVTSSHIYLFITSRGK